jgi:hypothetical protein
VEEEGLVTVRVEEEELVTVRVEEEGLVTVRVEEEGLVTVRVGHSVQEESWKEILLQIIILFLFYFILE